MKITDIKVTNFSQPIPPILRKRVKGQQVISLVRVVGEDGLEGYSMARANGGVSGDVLGEVITKTLKRAVVGQDIGDREKIWQLMWRQVQISYIPIFALSAVDVAVWDLAGKQAGLPVRHLLGGFRDQIPAYASSAFLDEPEEYLEDARMAVSNGIKRYKIHPFQDAARDIELCRGLRAAFDPEMTFMLDVGGTYDRPEALRVGRAVEELGFEWYEEPLPHYDLEGYRELSRDLDIPVIGAETVPGGVYSTALYLRANAMDMVLCDTYWRGGITGMIKTAHLCEAMGVKIVSHHGGSPLMNLANLQVLCAMKNADYVELLVPEDEYIYGIKSLSLVDEQGNARAPQSPGLGGEIDWDYIGDHTLSEL
ncbi:enolase C-terminal domain-like protein [Desulfoferula mesophila]|uniref:Mandelate racemase n=1 Tax=Desulfoferula mesophila TaxID=3058419 RepID=A0AAU9EB32_9BACT|nr:mandelate racemase [Desulfoferula mesophilus]